MNDPRGLPADPHLQSSPAEQAQSAEDARFAVALFAGFINNADTKCGLLGAAAAVAAGALISEYRSLLGGSFAGTQDILTMVVLSMGTITLATCGLWLMRGLMPRTPLAGFSRYSWPDVAATDLDELLLLNDEDDRAEAWREAQVLAIISRAKYRDFARALRSFSVSVVLIFIGALLLS